MAAAFIKNPRWLKKPGTCLYKIGDLVRYDSDRTMSFIGRKDASQNEWTERLAGGN